LRRAICIIIAEIFRHLQPSHLEEKNPYLHLYTMPCNYGYFFYCTCIKNISAFVYCVSHHIMVFHHVKSKIDSQLMMGICAWLVGRAMRPSTLKGCVGNLPKGYIRNVPLPRVPWDQSTFQSRVPPVHALPVYYEGTHAIPTYNSTCWIGERVA
jgi:hypothetical protein